MKCKRAGKETGDERMKEKGMGRKGKEKEGRGSE
jgi:hypothetical protein